MVEIGYALSSEEHTATELVRYAQRAEAAGFSYAMISDHFHPWIERQGQSTFVWSVLGGIANATTTLRVGTGVTCPIGRYHPALVAQAAATVASMMPGRFMLGVGTGENLNEHIFGGPWPPWSVRADMLDEAVGIIRALWSGKPLTHHGRHFTVEQARVYSLPEQPPEVIVAAAGPKAAMLAGRLGDGLINFSADPSVVDRFTTSGGSGKPRLLQVNVCWHEDERQARKIAREVCPTVAVPGEVGQFLPYPAHFDQVTQLLTEDQVAEVIVCGPDKDRHLEAIWKGIDAGYDHLHVDQVGPDQDGFFDFYAREILPAFR